MRQAIGKDSDDSTSQRSGGAGLVLFIVVLTASLALNAALWLK